MSELFNDMGEQIKDIDYYKAETQAARNGQIAAMELLTTYKQRAAKYQAIAEHRWGVGFLVGVGITSGLHVILNVLGVL